MLEQLHASFRILAKQKAAEASEIAALENQLGILPSDYAELIQEATEVEIQHLSGTYLRIWSPSGCLEMDEGYGILQRIPGAFPIGDDGGDRVIAYFAGKREYGLYLVGYGNLDSEDAEWIAPNLAELLTKAFGIENF